MAGVDGGECDAPVKITWPSDVDALKKRIDLQVDALDASVKACAGLDPAERVAWQAFAATWRAFAVEETPLFGTHGKWVTACTYAHTVDAWRSKVERSCNVVGPDPVRGAEDAADLVRWVAGAAIVVALVGGGIYAAHKLL